MIWGDSPAVDKPFRRVWGVSFPILGGSMTLRIHDFRHLVILSQATPRRRWESSTICRKRFRHSRRRLRACASGVGRHKQEIYGQAPRSGVDGPLHDTD